MKSETKKLILEIINSATCVIFTVLLFLTRATNGEITDYLFLLCGITIIIMTNVLLKENKELKENE